MRKAIRWIMPARQELEIEEFDFDETALAAREVAIETEYTTVSPGTECANYLALDPDVHVPGKWCAYPWTPGYSGVGRIIGFGSEVTELQIGDRVLAGIPHASHVKVNVDGLVVTTLPGINAEHAAHIMLISIGMTALQVLRSDPLGTVGVWGLGMIGNLAAQLLHRAGYRVIGIDPVRERRESALACLIDEALDPSDGTFKESILDLTRGAGLDAAVDSTGDAPTTIQIPEFIRRRGQMVLLTHWRNQPVVDAAPFIRDIFVKGITLHGAHANSPDSGPGGNHNASQRRKWMNIQHQLVSHRIAIEPLISHRIVPSQGKEAYDGLCFDRANWRGVVVDWRAGRQRV